MTTVIGSKDVECNDAMDSESSEWDEMGEE